VSGQLSKVGIAIEEKAIDAGRETRG